MLEKEILKLLRRISRQLEEIAATQEGIRAEMIELHSEFAEFQQQTLKNLEESYAKIGFDPVLN
jgi:hypothetical protein